MKQQVFHPSAVVARPQTIVAAPEAAQTHAQSHEFDWTVALGAVFLGWATVAAWLLLFISSIECTRGLLNAWF